MRARNTNMITGIEFSRHRRGGRALPKPHYCRGPGGGPGREGLSRVQNGSDALDCGLPPLGPALSSDFGQFHEKGVTELSLPISQGS